MPMVNLNKDKRSSRDMGKPALVTSENGNQVEGSCLTYLEKVLPFMNGSTPWLWICKNHWRLCACARFSSRSMIRASS